jgi:hypothetical protein
MKSGERGTLKILLPAIVFCLSFTVVFVALGMTATGLGSTLQDTPPPTSSSQPARLATSSTAPMRTALRALIATARRRVAAESGPRPGTLSFRRWTA